MSKLRDKDKLFELLEKREQELISKKKEVKTMIEELAKNVNLNKSKDFRYKITQSVSEIIKSIVQLHKLDMDIDSELIRLYQKSIDYIYKEEKKDNEEDIIEKLTKDDIDKLRKKIIVGGDIDEED